MINKVKGHKMNRKNYIELTKIRGVGNERDRKSAANAP